jgi:uncharacterized protein (TIGR03435 family)
MYPDFDLDPGYLTARAASVHFLILRAFGLEEFQLVDQAETTPWMKSELYAIHASAGRSASRAEMMVMLRGLLASRFHLVFHRETREMPVYALTVDAKGAKIQPIQKEQTIAELQNTRRRAHLVTMPVGSSVPEFVHYLNTRTGAIAVGLPVVDQTGLNGKYRIRLEFEVIPNAEGNGGKFEIDYFTELPKQLGLRLTKTKAPVEMVIVDSVQKPTLDH